MHANKQVYNSENWSLKCYQLNIIILAIICVHLVNAFIQCIQDLHFITSYIA